MVHEGKGTGMKTLMCRRPKLQAKFEILSVKRTKRQARSTSNKLSSFSHLCNLFCLPFVIEYENSLNIIIQ